MTFVRTTVDTIPLRGRAGPDFPAMTRTVIRITHRVGSGLLAGKKAQLFNFSVKFSTSCLSGGFWLEGAPAGFNLDELKQAICKDATSLRMGFLELRSLG